MGCSGTKETKKCNIKVVCLVGGPGCGKGTQSERLVNDHKFVHISTGDLLREDKKNNPQLAEIMNSGKLVSSDIIVKLVHKKMLKNPNVCYLLDGFPRNKENMEVLKKICGDSINLECMIFIETSDEVMMERLQKRAKEAEVKRDDDNENVQKNRIEVFKNETLPIVQMFEKENKCLRIDGNKSPDEVTEQINESLKAKGLGKFRTA